MKRRFWKRGFSALLGVVLAFHSPAASLFPNITSYAYTERSASINASSLHVRSGPGTGYSSVTKLTRGTAVAVINEVTGSDGKIWYQIRFTGAGGAATTGYALSTYISFPVVYSNDSGFEAQMNAQGFPESYKDGLRQLHAKYPNWVFEAQHTGLDWNTAIENEMILPRSLVDRNSISSYKSLQDGAYNWDTGEWVGFDGSTWVAASQEILSYYMDPRNALDQVSIFQFLSHKYDPNVQTRENLQGMVKGTFLEKNVIWKGSGSGAASSGTGSSSSEAESSANRGPGVSNSSGGPGVSSGSSSTGQTPSGSGAPSSGSTVQVELRGPMASLSRKTVPLLGETVIVGAKPGSDAGASTGNQTGAIQNETTAGTAAQGEKTYVDMIMDAAQSSGVNPYVLAAMILQEQGKQASGRSISGTVSGYAGFYNYFNVGAYASDNMSAVERGLWYASQSGNYGRPWNTPERSIIGGAAFYGQNYVNAGQDTFYLKKFNVQGSNIYKHQYMTNVDGAAAEAALFAEAYNDSLRKSALRFKIPVYQNMPSVPCAKPTGTGSPNNKLQNLYIDGFQISPAFHRDTTEYQVTVDTSVMNVNVNAGSLDSKASVSGCGNVQTTDGTNEITVRVTAQNGAIRDYHIRVVKQNGGPTYNNSMNTVSSGSGSTITVGGSSAGGPGVNVQGPGQSGSVSGMNGGSQGGPGGSAVTIIQ